jgi:hypothetical protein
LHKFEAKNLFITYFNNVHFYEENFIRTAFIDYNITDKNLLKTKIYNALQNIIDKFGFIQITETGVDQNSISFTISFFTIGININEYTYFYMYLLFDSVLLPGHLGIISSKMNHFIDQIIQSKTSFFLRVSIDLG